MSNQLLNRKKSSPLPPHTCSQSLALLFSKFFHSKINNICSGFTPDVTTPLPDETSMILCSFKQTTAEEIQRILQSIPPKSCDLDPIPTSLLKDCMSTFATIIAEIVNLSFQQASVPSSLKLAYIHPLFKKPSLDPDVLQNYRPVSNLPFLSKVLERVAFSQLATYLLNNHLLDSRQSAYRPHHSVETLLVNLSSDILLNMDSGKITAVLLLDLSSAFDTVNHEILINMLSSLGVRDQALMWFKSYLSCRSQIVCVNGCKSEPIPLTHGVPQGSVGGPLLFSIYLLGLKKILQRHDIKYHCYADDIQLYISFSPNQVDSLHAVRKLESCVEDIRVWMSSHSLKLNDEKSQFLYIGSKAQLSKIKVPSIKIGDVTISALESCRNLGIIFDSTMSMSAHISSVCKSVRYYLRNLGIIRKYLTRSATEKIVHAFISSRLDFGNAHFFQLPQSQLTRLQRLQNAAARLIMLSKLKDHITPILYSLHWLPVEFRIIFKLVLLVFHCLHGSAPEYNISIIKEYDPPRCLRSSNTGLLAIPKVRTAWGDRSFEHAGPYLWNELPMSVRNSCTLETFKTHLKSHLFKLAYAYFFSFFFPSSSFACFLFLLFPFQ